MPGDILSGKMGLWKVDLPEREWTCCICQNNLGVGKQVFYVHRRGYSYHPKCVIKFLIKMVNMVYEAERENNYDR